MKKSSIIISYMSEILPPPGAENFRIEPKHRMADPFDTPISLVGDLAEGGMRNYRRPSLFRIESVTDDERRILGPLLLLAKVALNAVDYAHGFGRCRTKKCQTYAEGPKDVIDLVEQWMMKAAGCKKTE